MTENKKNLNMMIIGTLLVSTIALASVSGVYISKYLQESDQHADTQQEYLDALNNYEETLIDLSASEEDLAQALQGLQQAESNLQLIQDNTEFSGTFYGLSQVDLNYDSSTVTMSYEISYSDYFFYRLTLEHPSHSLSDPVEVAQKIAGYCRPDSVSFIAEEIALAVSEPLNDECVIDGLLTFCQDRGDFEISIHYIEDGEDDFSKYPIETLAEGGGDCEDQAILFASLARALDYDVRICIVPGHAFVAVRLDSAPTHAGTWHFTIDDDDYYTCETTSYGWLIGDLPVEYQGVSVYSFPVL